LGDVPISSYPAGLVNWAGNRSGGVRRLFDASSGRPSQTIVRTNLLGRLESWARRLGQGAVGTPGIVLLVGGPGNGKTEAIESTVAWLDDAFKAGGAMRAALRREFLPSDGSPPSRLVRVGVPDAREGGLRTIAIVQDASSVTGSGSLNAAQMFLAELALAVAQSGEAYLFCVNRGILDDALIEAIDSGMEAVRPLLEAVTRAVGLAADSPECWPLQDHPGVAVWPMDVESLLVELDNGEAPPAHGILDRALDASMWPTPGTCEAGSLCPHCGSRLNLSSEGGRDALLKILRWYEVGSGRRWSFRDLFSLFSYLLAGHQPAHGAKLLAPCARAKHLLELDEHAKNGAQPRKDTSTAIFDLVSAQYQHALFHQWDKDIAQGLRRQLKELDLEDDNTAMGLLWFCTGRRSPYLPAMIASSLDGLVDLLDPALTSPDTDANLYKKGPVALREIDVRFSRSVSDGLEYVRRSWLMSKLELDLLSRIAKLDEYLSLPEVRRKRPATATQLQHLLRDFCNRLVRRTIGARTAVVRDAELLADFQSVVENSAGDDVFDVAREVERLLNSNQDFEVSLTTTFGQPLPPPARRATLVVPSRAVQPQDPTPCERPRSPIAFLRVGDGSSAQPIALTFELFKAVRELQLGMAAASLPPSVLALLDTTKARLSGSIVRDLAILDRARVRIGNGGVTIEQRRSAFAIQKKG
jgi:hypothetical protein